MVVSEYIKRIIAKIDNYHILYRDLIFCVLFVIIHIGLLYGYHFGLSKNSISITFTLGSIILIYYVLTSSCYYFFNELSVRLFCCCDERSCILHMYYDSDERIFKVRMNDSHFWFGINELMSRYLGGIYGFHSFDITLSTYKIHLLGCYSNCNKELFEYMFEDAYLSRISKYWVILIIYFSLILSIILF